MKRKLITSILILALALTGVLGATLAWFSDTGTSNANTFTAGSLDLKVNGSDENVRLFNLSDVHPECFVVPGNQPHSEYNLSNTGTIKGYLNIKNIVVTNLENLAIDPEVKAGDSASSTVGELGEFLNLRLWVDLNDDGWISTGEPMIFDGKINTLPSKFMLNLEIPAGGTAKVVGVISDWWSSANDNRAMTDSVTVDLTFTLDQKTQTN